ncbi:MAG: aminopeptidase P family N-terminal domain-containing protein, partial [Saccharolobus sp.]
MNRLGKLQAILEDNKIDCAIIMGFPNLFYFLEYSGVGALVYCDSQFNLLVPALDMYRAEDIKNINLIVYYPSKIMEN